MFSPESVLSASPSVGNSNHEVEDQDWFSDFDRSDVDDEPRPRLAGRIQTEASGYDVEEA